MTASDRLASAKCAFDIAESALASALSRLITESNRYREIDPSDFWDTQRQHWRARDAANLAHNRLAIAQRDFDYFLLAGREPN